MKGEAGVGAKPDGHLFPIRLPNDPEDELRPAWTPYWTLQTLTALVF